MSKPFNSVSEFLKYACETRGIDNVKLVNSIIKAVCDRQSPSLYAEIVRRISTDEAADGLNLLEEHLMYKLKLNVYAFVDDPECEFNRQEDAPDLMEEMLKSHKFSNSDILEIFNSSYTNLNKIDLPSIYNDNHYVKVG